MLLLHELAVVAGEPGGTNASVAFHGVAVDALAPVVTGVVQALVAVHATLSVRCYSLATRASERFFVKVC